MACKNYYQFAGHLKNSSVGQGGGNFNSNDANCGIYTTRISPALNIDGDSSMGFLNSFWFTLTGFFLQSTSVNPKVILFLLRK